MTADSSGRLGIGVRRRDLHERLGTLSAFTQRGRTSTRTLDTHQDFSPGLRLPDTPSQFPLHPHQHQAVLCIRHGTRTRQHAERCVGSRGEVGRAERRPASLLRRRGGVADGDPRFCMSAFYRRVSPRVCARTAPHRTRNTRCATLSHLRLQHYVEPLGHSDSTLDSTD